MILFLLLSLLMLRYVRSPKVLAAFFAVLFLVNAAYLFLQNGNLQYHIGLGAATLLALFAVLFIGRIAETVDRLRSMKG